MMRLWMVMVAALLAGSVLRAHDIAVFPVFSDGQLQVVVKYGHPGDYGDTIAGKLVELSAYPPSGEHRSLAGRVKVEGTSLASAPLPSAADPGTWVIASFYDNGFFVRTGDGRSVNTNKAEYPEAQAATHNLKFGKALLKVGTGGPGFDRVVGHRLELVPRTDPWRLRPGAELQLEARFENRPLPGATVVLYADATSTTTTKHVSDAAGLIRVPVSRTGLHIFSVEHSVASRHPDLATHDAYAASLVFTLP